MRGLTNFVLACFASLSLMAGELAPTGTLRATSLGGNRVQGTVDPKTGAVTGPVADIVKEWARQLGMPYAILPAPNAQGVIDRLKSHAADIGFLAFDEKRGAEVDFAGSYALMYNAFVVPADSPIQKTADADRAGVRIGAVRGQTQETYLSGNIKNGQVRVFETMPPPADPKNPHLTTYPQASALTPHPTATP